MCLIWENTIKFICDPHISRIEKILVKNYLKFLDFYASIYGNVFKMTKNLLLIVTCNFLSPILDF